MLPREIEEWLPTDVSRDAISSWALIARSFDRKAGQALVVRLRRAGVAILTRPSTFDFFRRVPLSEDATELRLVPSQSGFRLESRTVDGQKLSLALTEEESGRVRAVLDAQAKSDRSPSRSGTLRPPASAASEIVRIPASVAAPVLGAQTGASLRRTGKPSRAKDNDSDKPSSVRPPPFAEEPSAVVRHARDVQGLRDRFRQHWSAGELDEASQVARVLVHLEVADPVERRLAALAPELPQHFEAPLSPYLYRAYIAHDDEDPDLGRVFSALTAPFLAMRVRSLAEMRLKPSDEVDVAVSSHRVARTFAESARVIGMSPPRLFIREDVPGGMAHLPTTPAASLCGGTLATTFDPTSAAYAIGHHVSFYRSHAYVLTLAPAPADLVALIRAANHLVGRRPSRDSRVRALSTALGKQMDASERDALHAALEEFSASTSEPEPVLEEVVLAYRKAVSMTAARTGLLLCGSLAAAERVQRIMPKVPSVTLDDIADDLMSYSVSPSWLTLRKELGIAIEPSSPGRPAAR